MKQFRRVLPVLAVLLAAAGIAAIPRVQAGTPGDSDKQATASCDDLDPAHCLLPFPNDLFTVSDSFTDTGKLVDLDVLSMPRNVVGRPIDPAEWNRNDGFSPGSPILTRVPGLDLHRTWGSPLDHIQDLSWYERSDAPMVLVDADTGERHPFWSELDTHPNTEDSERLLVLRPAVNLTEGHRYIVALRHLRDGAGKLIPAGAPFAAYRNGSADNGNPRTTDLEEIFDRLGEAGVARGDLFLAWDFTVASERNLTERALSIRDDAFGLLGDKNLADGVVDGDAPSFAVGAVEDFDDGATMRRVEGTLTVPNYLTPQAEVGLTGPLEEPARLLLDSLPEEVEDLLDSLGLPIGVDDLVGQPLAVPGSRFNRLTSTYGLPARNPIQPNVEVPFVCNIARGSDTTPSTPMLYGHGLLGGRGEADGSSTDALRQRGFTACAVDWWGMSTADLPTVALILADASNMPSLADRAQQGFLNFLFLGRALAHPGGFASHEAFRNAGGAPLINHNLVYDGNSQGAIMGGALTALAPDFTKAVLGVPGMNYSTLLNRSVDWEGSYGEIFYAAYPDSIEQQLTFGLIQMLWDRAETNGYAQHMTDDPLPNTPAHEVFLQVAFADHQVTNHAAEVEARTIGARLSIPATSPNLHWSTNPAFELQTVDGDLADVGSVLVYWYTGDRDLGRPPNGNRPMGKGSDPHGDPRKYGPATDQVAHWYRTGGFIDVCAAGPCVIPEAP